MNIHDSKINQTWEAIDVGGTTNNFLIENINISDSYAYGVKIPHYASNGVVRNVQIANSAFSGVILAGQVSDIKFLKTKYNVSY